ncbi:MAG: putative 2,4-dihydroxyhept-2-ene,7-dioic acid aldolase [Firmicutes bacterium]|nr:putative 2,4-dihydroxyhept-2-ene,7-dioic acid aldolase [Bacillota bacterium]
MMNTSLKERLSNGDVALGAFVKLNCPSIVEMMSLAGFDFIIVDCEHSSFGYPNVEDIIRTADGAGLSSIIRLRGSSEEHILHALDSGAGGVQIPSLSTAQEVEQAVAYTKYYPAGIRGLSFNQRAAQYGMGDKNNYIKSSNENTIVVVHVENKIMADQVEKLCQIPQVDVLFIGPADLSQSMGKPGATNDPEVVAVIEKVFAIAIQHGKRVGIYVAGQVELEKYLKMGATYIAWKSDVTIFANAAKETVKAFKQYGKTV